MLDVVSINRLNLLKGTSLKINDELEIKHPTVNDILELGEKTYFKYIRILTISTKERADELWFDQKIWYEDISDWDLVARIRADEINADAYAGNAMGAVEVARRMLK